MNINNVQNYEKNKWWVLIFCRNMKYLIILSILININSNIKIKIETGTTCSSKSIFIHIIIKCNNKWDDLRAT